MKSRHNSNEPATELSDQALLGVFGGADAYGDPGAAMASSGALIGAASIAHVPAAAHGPGPVAHPVSAVPSIGSSPIGAVHAPVQGSHSPVAAPHAISSAPAIAHAPSISHGPAITHVSAAPHAGGISHAPTISHVAAISHAPVMAHAPSVSHPAAISHGGVAQTIQHALHTSVSHVSPVHVTSHGVAAISHGLPVHVVVAHAEAPTPDPTPHPDPKANPPDDHHDLCDHLHEIHERFDNAAKDFHEGLDHFIDGAADMAHAMVDLLPGGHAAAPGGSAGITVLRGLRRHR